MHFVPIKSAVESVEQVRPGSGPVAVRYDALQRNSIFGGIARVIIVDPHRTR